jgi:hypothetical protein
MYLSRVRRNQVANTTEVYTLGILSDMLPEKKLFSEAFLSIYAFFLR